MTSQLKYRADIDGLRALAVLSVVLYHLDVSIFSGGFVGVDVFFVISGYLITKIISTEIEKGNFSFSDFYERRIRRIFPALFVMIFASGIAGYLLLSNADYRSFFVDVQYAAFQISNFRFNDPNMNEYMVTGKVLSPLIHTWSLAVEEQFYLFWPIVLLGLYRVFNFQKVLIVTVLLLLLSLVMNEYALVLEDYKKAFYSTPLRAYELLIGGILAFNSFPQLKNKKIKEICSLFGLGLILLSIFTFNKYIDFPGIYALLPCLGAALFIYSNMKEGDTPFLNKALEFKPMVFIGLISYSLYLWHWPILAFYKKYYAIEKLNLLEVFVLGIISVCVAYVSYQYIEKPFRYKRKGADFSFFKPVVLSIMFLLSSSYMLNNAKEIGRSYSNDSAYEAEKFNPTEIYGCANGDFIMEGDDYKSVSNCIFDHHDIMPDVLLFGDSHGVVFDDAVEMWAKNEKLSFQNFSVNGCPSFFGDYAVVFREEKKKRVICSPLYKEIMRKISFSKKKPKYIFIANRNDAVLEYSVSKGYRKIYLQGDYRKTKDDVDKLFYLYTNTFKNLKSLDKTKVILVGQPRILKNNPFVCINHRDVLPVNKLFKKKIQCPIDIIPADFYTAAVQLDEELKVMTEGYGNVDFFDASLYVKKLYDDENRLLYYDKDHLSSWGASYLVKPLTVFMDNMK